MEQGGGVDGASQRLAYWLAWATCALSLTLTALNFLLIAMNVSLNTPAYVFWPELTSLAVGYSVIGAIIASRLPNHPIGWLCCAIGLVAAVDHFAGEYCLYALVAQPHLLPGGGAILWFQGWFRMLFVGLIVFLLLLFPALWTAPCGLSRISESSRSGTTSQNPPTRSSPHGCGSAWVSRGRGRTRSRSQIRP